MGSLPSSLYTPEQVARLDSVAINQYGIPGFTLMRRAARFTFETLVEHYPEIKKLLVVCGAGNNAGDGYVLARIARQNNIEVSVCSLIDYTKLTGDAAAACQQWLEVGSIESFNKVLIDNTELIVDAILGSGLKRDVTGEFANAIYCINTSNKPVLSIDIPSGINGETGQVAGVAIRADISVSFIGLKQGMFTSQGKAHSGKIYFNDLGVSEDILHTETPSAELLLSLEYLQKPAREINSYKNQFGHVLIAGGNTGMPGAVILTAKAALRTGAGMVSVVTLPMHVSAVAAAIPEVMVYGTSNGLIPAQLVDRVSHCVIGPGLGTNGWAQRLFHEVMRLSKPSVIDADALNLLANSPVTISFDHVITPHPGEAARLLSVDTQSIENNRFESVIRLAENDTCVAVLKGAGTLLSYREEIAVCPYGNPAMATAGMGDVLSGVIAALMAQGMSPLDAASHGVCMHGYAADQQAMNQTTLIASDVIDRLRML